MTSIPKSRRAVTPVVDTGAIGPLRPEDFPELQRFARRRRWRCGAERPWGLADAMRAAEKVVRYALGEVGVIAGREAADALRRWCSIYGSEQWWEVSQTVLTAYSGPFHTRYQLGGPPGGREYFDPVVAAMKLDIARLNAWLEKAIAEFYAARGQSVRVPPALPDAGPPAQPELPAQPESPVQSVAPVPPESTRTTAVEPTEPAAADKRTRTSPVSDPAVAAMRKAIDQGKVTRDQLRAIRVDDLPTQFPGLGSRTALYEARKKVLDEPAQ